MFATGLLPPRLRQVCRYSAQPHHKFEILCNNVAWCDARDGASREPQATHVRNRLQNRPDSHNNVNFGKAQTLRSHRKTTKPQPLIIFIVIVIIIVITIAQCSDDGTMVAAVVNTWLQWLQWSFQFGFRYLQARVPCTRDRFWVSTFSIHG